MAFVEFQRAFAEYPVISTHEILLSFPGFDPNALTRWQRKGWIRKIRRGFYRLASSPPKGEEDLFFISNRIYQPSYISLQSALRWHDLIPEGVFTITAVCTRKTNRFATPYGNFSYRQLRPKLFFGYRLIPYQKFHIKIAEPEKALLDLLYLNPHLSSQGHFEELRLNRNEIKEKIDLEQLSIFLQIFNSRALEKRTTPLIQYLESHASSF